MKSYIIPETDYVRLNLSDQLLDYNMKAGSLRTKKSDSWAKSNISLQTEDWGDENDNASNSQTQNTKSVWGD